MVTMRTQIIVWAVAAEVFEMLAALVVVVAAALDPVELVEGV